MKNMMGILAKKYTYDILKLLEKDTKRFKDISSVCESEKMRTQRLKELEQLNMIKAKAERIGGRAVSLYSISEKGRKILKIAEEIEKLK